MSTITATSKLSRNDFRARILRLAPDIRDQLPEELKSLDVVLAGETATRTLTISSGRTYLGGVSELFEHAAVLRRQPEGLEGRPSNIDWSLDLDTRVATIKFTPTGPWEPVGRPEGPYEVQSSVPSSRYFLEPLLRVLAASPEPVNRRELADLVADQLDLDAIARLEMLPSGKVPRYIQRSGGAGATLLRAGLIKSVGTGIRAITKAGLDFVRTHPDPLDEDQLAALCQRVAEVGVEDAEDEDADADADVDPADVAVGTWLRDVVLASYGHDARRRLVALLAEMIQAAHTLRPRSWVITRQTDTLRLLLSETVGLQLGRGRVAIGLHVGSIPEPARAAVEGDTDRPDFAFHRVESGVLRHFSASLFLASLDVLEPSSRKFLQLATTRNSPFARFHSPEAVVELEKLAGVALPQPASRAAAAPSSIPDLIAAGLAEVSPERIAVREAAVAEARAILENKRGALTEPDTRALLRLFNADLTNGRRTFNRFTPAFMGRNANHLVADLDELNRWIDALWNAQDDASVVRVLDDFWTTDSVSGAGKSFPTTLLHVRDPERFAPLMDGLAAGYRRLTGQEATRRKGAVYLEYAHRVVALRREYGISPHAIDVVLQEAGSDDGTQAQPAASAPEPPSPTELYDRTALLDDTGLSAGNLAEIESLLRDKPQLVLCGPPGTGKTFLAERLARYLVQGGGEWRLVQFHPSYGYEDFIEGIRPRAAAGGVTYDVEPGVFRTICQQAAALPDAKFVLVIDEINRGNLPRIFGELLYLLERRGPRYRVELAASREKFSVPENLIVIGTMNTADQSIALVDVALRRRFYFVSLEPDAELLRQWLTRHAPSMVHVAKIFARLNKALADEGLDENLCIGHSHFMVRGLDEIMLRRIWERGIRPTLADYFYGKPKIIAKFDYEKFVERELEDDEVSGEIGPDGA
jgi:hypothetical protein